MSGVAMSGVRWVVFVGFWPMRGAMLFGVRVVLWTDR
ncbi:MAG: hypothetical protein ACI8UD_001727 [Planctomycetota bacterium]|jgi:hypothetical protein